jgi:hypothetical protein
METKNLSDLHSDPKNPRRLSDQQGIALKNSMAEFGDLGCVVFNIQTQQMVGGHQRLRLMEQLPEQHKITISDRAGVGAWEGHETLDETGTVALGYIWIGNKQFAYREVNWDLGKQRSANIAANYIEGEFDTELLAEVNYELSQLANGDELLALTGQSPANLKLLANSTGIGEPDQAPKEPTMVLRIKCNDDAQMTELYQELKDRGLDVSM